MQRHGRTQRDMKRVQFEMELVQIKLQHAKEKARVAEQQVQVLEAKLEQESKDWEGVIEEQTARLKQQVMPFYCLL